MMKKFVPLNSNASPSPNPYEVRTYLGDASQPLEWDPEQCATKRICQPPANSIISKVLTIEDQLRMLHRKAKVSRFQRLFKKKCDLYDEFMQCVVPQRTPKELKTHAIMRERYLQIQDQMVQRVHYATGEGPCKLKQRKAKPAADFGTVQLESPVESADEEGDEEMDAEEEEEEGEEMQKKKIKPRMASPSCSLDVIFMPSEKLLGIKQPKSGMYHNETEPPHLNECDIPYKNYNPRILQEEFDQQGLKNVNIIHGARGENDLWTWNIGMQKQENDLENAFLKAAIPELDCNNMELTQFIIPNDIRKTFAAEIVFGNDAVQPEPPRKRPSYYNRPKEMACLYIAFVEGYRFNADFWAVEILDAILVAGEKLYKKSIDLNYKSNDTDFDILPQIAERQAALGLKVHFTGPLKNEPNIYKALSLYFSKYNTAILCSQNLYLLIWKRCQDHFYVFDPNGRNMSCARDYEEGKCSLISLRHVEHLVHLVLEYSNIKPDAEFNLYEVFLINYGKLTQPIPTQPMLKRTRKLWAVVNDYLAIIPAANNGLTQPITGNELNSSMIISLLALLYAQIESASQWRTEVLDDIVKFGQTYYKSFVKKHKFGKKQQLNITDLPEVIVMGAYRAMLKKRPFLFTGQVVVLQCQSFLHAQITVAVQELYSSEWQSALLQIDNSVLSIWRDKNFFYLFDPFRRGKSGQVLDPEDYLTRGVACLEIHANFKSFCRILYKKALGMRRGGTFFFHGINITSITPMFGALNLRSKYARLQLAFPKYTDEPEVPEKIKKDKKKKKDKKDKKDKKKGKLGRTVSIQSIPDEDRLPDHDDQEVVDAVLEEILCEIFQKLEEPKPLRPKLYDCAKKVLLRTDQPYLESLKYKLKHGLNFEDSIYAKMQTYPEGKRKLTLEEELQLPSNFEQLPDGSWIIFGTSQLPMADDSSAKLTGLLSGLITAALTSKYSVATWNSELVDYALESISSFDDDFQQYENSLTAIMQRKLPKIVVGKNSYRIEVNKITRCAPTRSLRQVLVSNLADNNRLMVFCQHFCCLIIKRYNFLYMFIGFPCNSVGFRKFAAGPGCMLRFVELDGLIRRIEFGCNPQGCPVTNYVTVAIRVVNATNEPPEMFRKLPDLEENALYAKELEAYQSEQKRRMDKIQFIDSELRKENARIKQFIAAKNARIDEKQKKAAKRRQRRDREEESDFMDGEENEGEFDGEEEEEAEEEEIEPKHKPGKKLKKSRMSRYKPRPVLYGYSMREKDCLFKIQGSTALDGRAESSIEDIKACFFASTLAILYAILRPLNQWTAQRVDRVIESGKDIASKVTNMTTSYERIIKKVTVDEYQFDVWVKTFEPAGVWGSPVERKLRKATQSRRYLMLQTSNCTYAIYRDEYYHLFDPYASMELAGGNQEEEGEEDDDEGGKKKKKCPKGIPRFGERNTASWVLCADIESMLKYIDQRSAIDDWKEQGKFQFHVVDVLSYKRAAPSARILQLLTDLSVPMECNLNNFDDDEANICAHSESISWLDVENCLPVWSRMNRRNTAGRYRNLPITKLKKYDIEIEGRLWSLWGNLHPLAPVFESATRGKQYLACNVVACCAANIYQLTDWSAHLLDTIVISGDKYHRQSLANIKMQDFEFALEDLNIECALENIKFVVHLEMVAFGKLYASPSRTNMNMADALMYFFAHFQFGILQCLNRSLAIGRTLGHDGGYFMYDCQSKDHPLFPKGQGASYVLRTKFLQVLLYCIVITLNVPYFNVQFTLHKVEMLRDGGSVLDEEGEDEAEDEANDNAQ